MDLSRVRGDPLLLYITMTLTDPDAAPHSRHSMLLRPGCGQGHRDFESDEGLWRRRRAARTHAYPFSRRASGEQGCDDPWPRTRLRDRAGAARSGTHPPLHARDRPGRAGARGDVPARRDRTAFGQKLARLGANPDIIAEARMSIEMARLLCLKAAWAMDTQGVRAAAPLISQIKVIAPRIALDVIDQAVQMHGGAGSNTAGKATGGPSNQDILQRPAQPRSAADSDRPAAKLCRPLVAIPRPNI